MAQQEFVKAPIHTPIPIDTKKRHMSFGEIITEIKDLVMADSQPWIAYFNILASRRKTEKLLDFPSTSSGSYSQLAVTIPGVILSDHVLIAEPVSAMFDGCFYRGRPDALITDTIVVEFYNFSGAPVDPPEANFVITLLR